MNGWNRRTTIAPPLVSCVAFAVCLEGGLVQLIVNGGFETGDFSGWTTSVEPRSAGNLFVNSGTTSPLNSKTTAGPASGIYYALTDQNEEGAYALTQSFSVTKGAANVTLSFDLFANQYAAAGAVVGPLDYTSGTVEFATADLLTASANPFSTAPADVLKNFYAGADTFATNPNPWTFYSFDITSLVSKGGTFQVRFGEADNAGNFNLGVDNVSVLETLSTSVPEPATFLLLLPFAGVPVLLKRRDSERRRHSK